MQKSEVENQQNEESEDVIYKPVDKKSEEKWRC